MFVYWHRDPTWFEVILDVIRDRLFLSMFKLPCCPSDLTCIHFRCFSRSNTEKYLKVWKVNKKHTVYSSLCVNLMFTIALYDSVLIKATKADVRRRDGMKGQEGGRCGSWSYNITKIEIQKEDMTSDFSSWATPMIPVLCQKKQIQDGFIQLMSNVTPWISDYWRGWR